MQDQGWKFKSSTSSANNGKHKSHSGSGQLVLLKVNKWKDIKKENMLQTFLVWRSESCATEGEHSKQEGEGQHDPHTQAPPGSGPPPGLTISLQKKKKKWRPCFIFVIME